MSSRFSPEPQACWPTSAADINAEKLDSPTAGGPPAISVRLEMLNTALIESDKLSGMLEDRIAGILRPRSEPEKGSKGSEPSPVSLAADLDAFIHRVYRLNDQLRNVWERVEL